TTPRPSEHTCSAVVTTNQSVSGLPVAKSVSGSIISTGSPMSSRNTATASSNADWMASGKGPHGANRGVAYRRPGRASLPARRQGAGRGGRAGGRAGERGGSPGSGPGLHGEQGSQVRNRRREDAVGGVIDPVGNRRPGDQAVSRFHACQPAEGRGDPNGPPAVRRGGDGGVTRSPRSHRTPSYAI